MSHPASVRRRAAATAGVAALALTLAACGDGSSADPAAAPATPTGAATSLLDADAAASAAATDPASQAASRIAAAKSASLEAGTQRPSPRAALETVGPGITDGAATQGWQSVAAGRNDTVSVMDCTQDVLDQKTLDAVATHIRSADTLEIVQLFASHDESHEFLTCVYNGYYEDSPGMPLAQVHYEHNLDGSRLKWCEEQPAATADEYSFDPETGKGLLALLRPGMTGGQDGAPLLPQRTAWACSEDGTQMVSATFGAMEGYGDANEGLTQVTDSPVAQSTTLVTQTRDHLADTVLQDPAHFHEVIQNSSPYFLDAQMDQETLDAALALPSGDIPKDKLTDQSTIERPEGAPEPVAPGQPPRPFQGAAREAAESAKAAGESQKAEESPSSERSPSSASPSRSGD